MSYHFGSPVRAILDPKGQGPDVWGIRLRPDFDRASYRFFRQFNGTPPRMSLNDFLIRFERAIVFNTLVEMNGCQRRAAAFLKLKNTTLNRKIKVQHIQFTKIPLLPGSVGPAPPGGGSSEW